MTKSTNFAASASTTHNVPPFATVLSLPTVDSGNLDVLLENTGSAVIILSHGAGAVVRPNVAGCINLPAGDVLLLTSNSAILAGTTSGKIKSGVQAAAAAGSVVMTAMAIGFPSSITIQRGTATIGETL